MCIFSEIFNFFLFESGVCISLHLNYLYKKCTFHNINQVNKSMKFKYYFYLKSFHYSFTFIVIFNLFYQRQGIYYFDYFEKNYLI